MIQLGFIQIIGIHFAGLYNGLMAIFGIVYCSAPDFVYVSSAIVTSHWVLTSTTCDVLAINRLCELFSAELAEKLFGGRKLYLWMAFPFMYSLLMFFKMSALMYNSKYMAFFSNPHLGYVVVGFGNEMSWNVGNLLQNSGIKSGEILWIIIFCKLLKIF
jgi:hypothetical protein